MADSQFGTDCIGCMDCVFFFLKVGVMYSLAVVFSNHTNSCAWFDTYKVRIFLILLELCHLLYITSGCVCGVFCFKYTII